MGDFVISDEEMKLA